MASLRCAEFMEFDSAPKHSVEDLLFSLIDMASSLSDATAVPSEKSIKVRLYRRDRLVAEGSTLSVPIEDLDPGWFAAPGQVDKMEVAKSVLRRTAIRPVIKYGSPFSDAAKPISTGFVRRGRLHLVRGVGYEAFGAPAVDNTSTGEDLPRDVQFHGSLRKSQVPVVRRMISRYRSLEHTGAQLLVNDSDPGQGKTCMAIGMALLDFQTMPGFGDSFPFSSRGRTMIIVRGRRIVFQWVESLVKFGVSRANIGVMLGGRVVLRDCCFVVASVDTLVSRGHEYPMRFWRSFRMTIFDEAHHMNTRTFSEVFIRCAQSRYVMCLTGTWQRSDGTSEQLRYMTGLPVGGAKNTMPVEVRMKTYLAGTTEFEARPSRKRGRNDERGEDDGGEGGEANTSLMVSKLGEDEGRTRFIINNIAEFVEEGGKVLVIVDRNDIREALAAMVEKRWGGRVDLRERRKDLVDIPVPATPLAKMKAKIDRLGATIENELEKRRPDRDKITKAKDNLARQRLQLRFETLHEMVRFLNDRGGCSVGDGETWLEEWQDELRQLQEHRPTKSRLSKKERVDSETMWWTKMGVDGVWDSIQDEMEALRSNNRRPSKQMRSFLEWVKREREQFLLNLRGSPSAKVIEREETRVAGVPIIEESETDPILFPLVGVLRGGISDLEAERAKLCRVIFANAIYVREAMDIPDLDRLVFATPMANVKQAIGRVRRQHPSKKLPVKLLDVVDNVEPFRTYAFVRKRYYNTQPFRVFWTQHEDEHDMKGQPMGRPKSEGGCQESEAEHRIHKVDDDGMDMFRHAFSSGTLVT